MINKLKKIDHYYIWITISVLSLLYGIANRHGGAFITFYNIWFYLSALFSTFAILSKFNFWSKLPRMVRYIIHIIIVIMVLSFIIIEILILSSYHQKGPKKLDYLIVLGANVHNNGPCEMLRYRLDETISYLNDNPNTKCILSGGKGPDEPIEEAVSMSEYLIKHGISSERLLIEKKSNTTKENISNSMKMIPKNTSVGIVTNNFHIFRATQIAKRQGLSNVHGISSDSKPLYTVSNLVREYCAEIKFLICQ